MIFLPSPKAVIARKHFLIFLGVLLLLPLLLTACKSTLMEKSLRPNMQNLSEHPDPFLWLEEVEGEKALEFAKAENKRTLDHFRKNPLFKDFEKDTRDILLAKDRVPSVSILNGELYNFWQDDVHVRGVWRKTSIESYKSANPKWEILLDLDALAKVENENWVWKGQASLPPAHERVLLYLSRGGKDATVLREFNLKTKSFVADGFNLPEAKSSMDWKDENTVYVRTDFGPGSLTDSGYPRLVKLWKRGTPLEAAQVVHQGQQTDMSVYTGVYRRPEASYVIHMRRISFYSGENWLEDEKGQHIKIPMPVDAELTGIFKGHLLFLLRSDLQKFKKGSLVALPIQGLTAEASYLQKLQLIFAPSEKKIVQYPWTTQNYILLQTMDNVLSKMERIDLKDGRWVSEELPLGQNGVASVDSTDESSDLFIAQYVDFLTPYSNYLGDATKVQNTFELLKKSSPRFKSEGVQVERFEAISKDGTAIPYFVVGKKSLLKNGKNPTLLYGYGGFEHAMQPNYLGTTGKNWIERGGIYVLSNLRGGGEFGPGWHQSVLKENRYKVYEDFISIAEDLISRNITSPPHLAIKGGSNGGLLVGATVVLRPDLFNAALCQVPLLDMLRYHKLLAGASWMAEYGDPDIPVMRDAILKYSPYQKVSADVKYPEVLFMTSTKDDRVHPGHARKMVAKMKEQGHSVFYYENLEGGHAGNANIDQSILWIALENTYLWEKLGPK